MKKHAQRGLVPKSGHEGIISALFENAVWFHPLWDAARIVRYARSLELATAGVTGKRVVYSIPSHLLCSRRAENGLQAFPQFGTAAWGLFVLAGTLLAIIMGLLSHVYLGKAL